MFVVEPEYITKQGRVVERCYNQSVEEAVEHMIDNVPHNTSTLINAINTLLEDIPQTKCLCKADSIFYNLLVAKQSKLCPFVNSVKHDYENILMFESGLFNKDVHDQISNLFNIEISAECLHDTNNIKYMARNTWFGNRICLYNPSVNFEHVCYLVDMMLSENIKPSIEVLAPFYYILKQWSENRGVVKWLVYHYMKLIRVNIIGKYSQTLFNPAQRFTNMRFGAITDQNIEVYGNVKLSDDENNLMSLFSLLPRTQVVKTTQDERCLFVDWNPLTPIIKTFTKSFIELFDNHADAFEYMTDIDIKPRGGRSYNAYKTVYIDDSLLYKNIGKDNDEHHQQAIKQLLSDIPDALYITLVNYIIDHSYQITDTELSVYENYVVYITYTGADGVKTVSTHRTLGKLIAGVVQQREPAAASNAAHESGFDDTASTAAPVFHRVENILPVEHRDYIPHVVGGFSRAMRNIITPHEKTWEELYTLANNMPFPAPVWPGVVNDRPQPF